MTDPAQASYAADRELVRRALRHERDAVQSLIQRLARVPALIRAKNRRLGGILTPEEEKDTAQDALTAIWAKLPTFAGRSRIDTWIYGFAATQVMKAVQTKARSRVVSGPETLDPADPTGQLEALPIDPQAIHEALENLDPANAEVIRLRHFEDLSFEDISTRLDTNLSTVKARYYRSMPKLQQELLPIWEENKS